MSDKTEERWADGGPAEPNVGPLTRWIRPSLGPIARAQKDVRDQEEWIRDHGATLDGYIERYGTTEDPLYGTMGGPAIYTADVLHLHLLVNLMRKAARKARQPHVSQE